MAIPFKTVHRAGQIMKLLRMSLDPKLQISASAMHQKAMILTDDEKKEAGVWAKAIELAHVPTKSVENAALELTDMISKESPIITGAGIQVN